ncbi:hypothetical protein O5O45_01595 [Hahella aquimaris]|uniref:hypothetical protein n=1 Tax=Hahella sp. HNIBRBA332 TaxID=3015983 RepID=UPI00273BD7F5|nr:hypothetical protein [Hahella sp. HNIBRBA332]WLQ14630.1 hypothetical protein O5O45_01595 [Hahella sp. HNIBRBA332]
MFTPLALIFLAFYIVKYREQLWRSVSLVSLDELAIAVLLILVSHLVVPIVSQRVLATNGVKVSYKKVLYIHLSRLPARYLPGGIWQTVTKLLDYDRLGVGKTGLLNIFLFEVLISVITALIVGGGLILLSDGELFYFFSFILVIVALLGFCLVFVLRGSIKLSWTIVSLSLYSIVWLGYGFSFAIYTSEALGSDFSLLILAGSYLLSWVVGFLAFFAPQGIGVTEYVLQLLIAFKGELSLVLVSLFGFRLVVLVGDMLGWIFSFLLKWTGLREEKV